jgi:hypothetical protein
MGPPETEKAPPSPDESALQKVEQLGGPLNKTGTETLDQLQARTLRRQYALAFYVASTVAAFAVSR